jgi:site-specific recombinase XerD
MIERAAIEADLGIKAHAHMLRHACGYKLANDGIDTRALQAYLGHRNTQNTTRYTALAPDRFKGFWRDEHADGRKIDARVHPGCCTGRRLLVGRLL